MDGLEKLSIVIPTYNRSSMVSELLVKIESEFAKQSNFRIEIIVSDKVVYSSIQQIQDFQVKLHFLN